MKLSFVVPGPPIPKARARVFATSKGYKSASTTRTADYEKHISIIALAARQRTPGWEIDHYSYSLTIRVYRDKATGDLDNFIKSVDALNGIVWEDDRVLRKINAEMFDGDPNPRLEIEVEMM